MSWLKRFFEALDDYIEEKTRRENTKYRHKFKTQRLKKKKKRWKDAEAGLKRNSKRIFGK